MLNDPENPDEQPFRFIEPILASSLDEATRICRRKAQEQGETVQLKEVKAPSVHRPGHNQRYICIFESNPIE